MSVNQMFLAAFGLTAVYMSMVSTRPTLNKWAPVVGLAGQPFWLYATITAEQWGMVALCVCYSALYARGAWRVVTWNR